MKVSIEISNKVPYIAGYMVVLQNFKSKIMMDFTKGISMSKSVIIKDLCLI